jgi:hypothetical protein
MVLCSVVCALDGEKEVEVCSYVVATCSRLD